MQPAIRKQDAKEIVRLNLTARGKPVSSTPADILDWFDMGHVWIVQGFTDFTTTKIHGDTEDRLQENNPCAPAADGLEERAE
jgi:hypothetical protein